MGLLIDKAAGRQLFNQAAQSASMGGTQPIHEIRETDDDESALILTMLGNIEETLAEDPKPFFDHFTGSENKPQALGEIVGEFLLTESQAIQAAGQEIPKAAMHDVAREVTATVLESIVAAGIYKPQNEQEVEELQQKAILYATDRYASVGEMSGMITPEDQEGMAKALEPIMNSSMTTEQFNQMVE